MKPVKSRHRFRCLVDQTTKIIVWMGYEAADLLPTLVDASLNYMRLNFESSYDIYRGYERYILYSSADPAQIVEVKNNLDKLSSEFVRIQLLRAKATALASIGHNIKNSYERLHYFDTKLIDAYRTSVSDPESDWVKFVSNEFNLDADSAVRLMKFKIEEYDSIVFMLETLRITSSNTIKAATTLADVDEAYMQIMTTMLRHSVTPLRNRAEIIG